MVRDLTPEWLDAVREEVARARAGAEPARLADLSTSLKSAATECPPDGAEAALRSNKPVDALNAAVRRVPAES